MQNSLLKEDSSSPPTVAGGCCYVPPLAERVDARDKHILVYPYTDPSIPFDQLTPDQITFYFHVTNKTGHASALKLMGGKREQTCSAQCSGCYFQTLPPYAVEPELAQRVAADFRAQGYDMGLITADSFSEMALTRIGQAGSAFRYSSVSKQNGNAWTNGIQLSGPAAGSKLDRGWDLGYGVVTLSLYAMALPHPMAGIPSNRLIQKAIARIRTWNADRFPEGGGYDIITTQVLSRQTCNLDDMRKAAQWCLENGIRVCRFNAFANFTQDPVLKQYELCAEDIRRFWRALAQLQEEFRDTPLQFGVSEDMSAEGIEACIPLFNPKDGWEKFDPQKPYWCRAGYRLFSINGVRNDTTGQIELIITGCVDNWSKAPIGRVVQDAQTGRYRPEFDTSQIERLRAAVLDGTLSTCWGGVGNPGPNGETRGFVPSFEAAEAIFK